MSAKDKHKAIIIVSQCEVHALTDTGECEGIPVPSAKLKAYGIKFPFVITVDGFDQHDCLVQLKNRLIG